MGGVVPWITPVVFERTWLIMRRGPRLSKWRVIWSIQKPLFLEVSAQRQFKVKGLFFWTCTNCSLAPGKCTVFLGLFCFNFFKMFAENLTQGHSISDQKFLRFVRNLIYTWCRWVLHEKQGQPHKMPTFEKEFSGTEGFFRRGKLFNLVQEAWR